MIASGNSRVSDVIMTFDLRKFLLYFNDLSTEQNKCFFTIKIHFDEILNIENNFNISKINYKYIYIYYKLFGGYFPLKTSHIG